MVHDSAVFKFANQQGIWDLPISMLYSTSPRKIVRTEYSVLIYFSLMSMIFSILFFKSLLPSEWVIHNMTKFILVRCHLSCVNVSVHIVTMCDWEQSNFVI